MRENILPSMPLEHEAIGADPFIDREQPPTLLDRARRAVIALREV